MITTLNDQNNHLFLQYTIRESVDSLCRDGADRTRPFSKIEWLRTPKRGSYKPFLDTYTYSTSDSVPAKTLKVRKIHSYNDLRNMPHVHPFFGYFCSSSSSSSSSSANSVELAYRKSGTSTVLGFYMKRLLSLACVHVILDQENLRNFTHNCIIANSPYLSEAIFCVVTCISRFIERWGSSARAGPRE